MYSYYAGHSLVKLFCIRTLEVDALLFRISELQNDKGGKQFTVGGNISGCCTCQILTGLNYSIHSDSY